MEKELDGTEKATRAKKRVGEYVGTKMVEEEEVRKERSDAKKMKSVVDDGMELYEAEKREEEEKKRTRA